jgi:hypothetical protein
MAANGNGRPKAITKQQREEFLRHVREGMNRAQAAAQVGVTGSRFRSLCLRDEQFAALFEEASAEGRDNFLDDLREQWRRRAEVSDRLLTLRLITYLPEVAWKRNAGRAATTEEAVKQHIDVAIESVLDELAARREARAVRPGTPAAVAGNGKTGPASP